jgi:hypothetical protein
MIDETLPKSLLLQNYVNKEDTNNYPISTIASKWTDFDKKRFIECSQRDSFEVEFNSINFNHYLNCIEASYDKITQDDIRLDLVRKNISEKMRPQVSLTDDPNRLMKEKFERSLIYIDIESKNSPAVCYDPAFETRDIVDLQLVLRLFPEQERKNFQKLNIFYRRFIYRPDIDSIEVIADDKTSSYNTHQKPSWRLKRNIVKKVQKPAIIQLFQEHLLCNDFEQIKYLDNWVAFSLKQKCPVYLGLVGAKGVGKNIFFENIVMALHGLANSAMLKPSFFKNKFNAEAKNKSFGFIDEVYLPPEERKEMSNFKRGTGDMIAIEEKFKTPTKVKNHMSMALCGNDYDAVPYESDNRRLSLLKITDTKLKNTPLIHRIDELIDEDTIREYGWYLLLLNPTFEELRDPFEHPDVIEKIKTSTKKGWQDYLETWISGIQLDRGNCFPKRVTIEGFQKDFLRDHPNWGKSAPGRTTIERFFKDNSKFKCRVGKNGPKEGGKWFIEIGNINLSP